LTRFSTLFSGTSTLIIIVDVDILTVKNIDTLLILPMFFKIVVPLS
jgi:alpha-N-acetylglucosamine transferase